ncbi:FkbM family methyltransferase [Nocardioides albidus]|uniref:FkbM family methyltransferase n=1 Tax=Nocardioides albidus TaxID=1517589 RepID=A0A5C4W7E6_9ACTN|nr:FkbM family methyltransferase [Nocardioides albidus]TNM44130.1 FkbM family methyltransferase [Nocardioides albidus]
MTTFWFKATTKLKIFLLEGVLRPLRPPTMVRFGTFYGGWWIPDIRPGAVAVCVGAGTDVSFDLELDRLGYRVVTVDPTPAARAYLADFADRLEVLPVGLWTTTGEVEFAQDATFDESWMIGNATTASVGVQGTDTFPVVGPKDLVARVGVVPDVLKLDIEGAEHAVLRVMLEEGVRPRCLCVEFDDHRITAVLASTRLLRRHGYTLYHIEGLNYLFVREG